MELQLMLGRMEGRRGTGRPRCTCLNNINNDVSTDITNLRLDARDRAGWRIATVDVAKVTLRCTVN